MTKNNMSLSDGHPCSTARVEQDEPGYWDDVRLNVNPALTFPISSGRTSR